MYNFKRLKLFRLYSGFLVLILLINFSFTVYAGCSGDCMSCHPKLIGDETHISMTMCANCHNKSEQNLSITSSLHDGCGDRCFDCHNKWPQDGYHADLEKCIKCHTNQ